MAEGIYEAEEDYRNDGNSRIGIRRAAVGERDVMYDSYDAYARHRSGEHPTRDDLSGKGEEKHDGTSDNRRTAGRGGGRNDDPPGGEESLYPHSDSLLS